MPIRDQIGQLRTVLEKPLHSRRKLGQKLQHLGFQNQTGKHGNQTHDRMDLQGNVSVIRKNQLIVIELVGLVPQTQPVVSGAIDRASDGKEVIEELHGDVLIRRIMQCQFESRAQQEQTVHRHPAGGVRLVDETAGRQRAAAIEHANVVETQKAALKDVAPLRVLSIDPPCEIHCQLIEDTLQEFEIAGVSRV